MPDAVPYRNILVLIGGVFLGLMVPRVFEQDWTGALFYLSMSALFLSLWRAAAPEVRRSLWSGISLACLLIAALLLWLG